VRSPEEREATSDSETTMKQRNNEMKVPSRKKSQFHNDPTYKISEVSGEKPKHLDD